MKKLALVFLIFAISSQAAFAIIPLLVAGSRIVSAGLKTSIGQDIAIGSVLGVGLMVAQLNWQRQGTNGSTNTSTLHYTNTPRSPSSIESAAGFTAGYPSLTPQSTMPSISGWTYPYGGSFSATLLGAVTNAANANCPATQNSITADESTGEGSFKCGGQPYGGYGSRVSSCPSGYTASGSICNLTASNSVPRPLDGYCPINRSGSTYSVDSTDPDCATAAPTFAPDGSFSITGSDGRTISSAPSGSGVSGERKIIYTEPDTSTNTTHTREIVMQDGSTEADTPYIKGVIDKYTQGTGAAGTTTTATPPTTVSDHSGVIAAIDADKASREAYQAAEPARIAADRAAERAIPPIGEAIPTLTVPFAFTSTVFASSASCPADISFTVFTKTYAVSYTPMCNLMTTLRPLFLSLGAFAATFIFIGGIKV